MDIEVHFSCGNRVVLRYLCSQFLGHTSAADIKEAFKEGTKNLGQSKMLQISMDGPATNLKFLKQIVSERNQTDANIPQLLELGSCSLHKVHGAFSAGIQKTGWNIDRLLCSL